MKHTFFYEPGGLNRKGTFLLLYHFKDVARKHPGLSRALLLRSVVSLEASPPKEFEANGKWRLRRTDIVGNIAVTAITNPCFFKR